MIEIINKQKIIDLDPHSFRKFTVDALATVPGNSRNSITIAFISDTTMKELNHLFRNKYTTTDVLSFPNQTDQFEADENFLGDIVISSEQARRQALDNDLDLGLEIKQLILHGILHLCGYDHETDKGEMNEVELKLRDKLGIC